MGLGALAPPGGFLVGETPAHLQTATRSLIKPVDKDLNRQYEGDGGGRGRRRIGWGGGTDLLSSASAVVTTITPKASRDAAGIGEWQLSRWKRRGGSAAVAGDGERAEEGGKSEREEREWQVGPTGQRLSGSQDLGLDTGNNK